MSRPFDVMSSSFDSRSTWIRLVVTARKLTTAKLRCVGIGTRLPRGMYGRFCAGNEREAFAAQLSPEGYTLGSKSYRGLGFDNGPAFCVPVVGELTSCVQFGGNTCSAGY